MIRCFHVSRATEAHIDLIRLYRDEPVDTLYDLEAILSESYHPEVVAALEAAKADAEIHASLRNKR